MPDPMTFTCPLCGVSPGNECVTKSGKSFRRVGVPGLTHHVARIEAASKPIKTKTGKVLTDADIYALADEAERGYDISHLKHRLPRKLKHRVRCHGYVWCDPHGAVHPAEIDYFDEADRNCDPINWRRVYVETDDKDEAF